MAKVMVKDLSGSNTQQVYLYSSMQFLTEKTPLSQEC